MENELSHLVNALPGLVWTALPDGSNDFFNQRWREYTGLSLEESCGSAWQAAIHPEDLPRLVEQWRSILASGQPGKVEGRLRRFDGEYRWFHFSSHPLRDEQGRILRWYVTATDIENWKQTEARLEEEQRELRKLIDLLPQHVLVLDSAGSLLQANQTMLEYSGHTLEEM